MFSVRSKYSVLKKIIDARMDPAQVAAVRGAPLSSEQAVQQHEIRAEALQVQKLLSQAEEDVTLLKAKLAGSRGFDGERKAHPSPTVEAVVRTIMKLTSMAEKKSGDVDVLENHLRKLKMVDEDENKDDSLPMISNSPFSTPQGRPSSSSSSSTRPMRNDGFRTPPPSRPAAYGLFYTPESPRSASSHQSSSTIASPPYRSHPHHPPHPQSASANQRGQSEGLGNSTMSRFSNMGMSRASVDRSAVPTTAAQRAMTEKQLKRMREREDRKREVAEKLSTVLSRIGPRVRSIDP